MTELPRDLMVSVSGVRGRVGEALTPEIVTRFASAFGAYVTTTAPTRPPKVVVARDSRTSGPLFARCVTAALQSVGCEVLDVGLTPTPTALLAVRYHRAAGAVVVTASHNPVEWNALKFASSEAMFLDAEQAARMRAFLDPAAVPRARWDGLGDVVPDPDAIERHVEAVLAIPFLDVKALRRRAFKVALDCVRGAGGVLLPRLLRELGCTVVGIHLEPDGRFPRPPEPVPENLAELERLVRDSGADVGLATDPDADRLSLVSERGRALGEDYTLALAAALVLRHRKGAVVTNLSTSRVVEDAAAAAGVPLYRAPVGEIHVARRMQAVGAIVGGEGNGGVILPDVHLTRDAAVASVLLLQLLLEEGRPLAALLASRPAYTIVKDKLPREGAAPEEAYDALAVELPAPDVDRQDGLRLAWPEQVKWLHVRASGTEPILRMIAEAATAAEAHALVARARDALARARQAPGSGQSFAAPGRKSKVES
ncbi:MAG: phosphoglucosamine mutase [Gemmatimonadetes bacterium]|nr:phosphoglucosamine mutase [Gemmatimonadota bacterium]